MKPSSTFSKKNYKWCPRICEGHRASLVEKENDDLKEKLKKIEEEKMKLELYLADVVDDHKIKMDAMRLKIRKIRKYAINKEAWYHYVVGSMVTLVAILIAFVIEFKCIR